MRGAVHPASIMRCLISGTAAAASGVLTVTRTISDPASASSTHCRAVAAASLVSVIVMLWTTMGAPPPTWTSPTRTPKVLCSLTGIAIDSIIRRPAGRGWSHNIGAAAFDVAQARIATPYVPFGSDHHAHIKKSSHSDCRVGPGRHNPGAGRDRGRPGEAGRHGVGDQPAGGQPQGVGLDAGGRRGTLPGVAEGGHRLPARPAAP